MDPTAQLALASLLFLVTHFVPSTPLRPALVNTIGERAYLGTYTVVAFATIIWMARSYGAASTEALWSGPRILPMLVMPIALILLVCGVASRNPTAVRQESLLDTAEPARGMLRVTRHPAMWAFMLWAGAHTIALGTVRALILFGSFLLLAALGTLLIDARKATRPGDGWRRFAAATSNVPFVAIAQGRNRFDAAEIGWVKPLVGLVLFAVLLAVHPWLFGVRPY